jgi:hypothetical protein
MIILFNACGNLGTNEALNLIKKTSKQIPKSSYSNPRLLTSLLDALMKCGDITSAQTLFDTSTKKTLPMYGVMMKGNNCYVHNYVQTDFLLQVIFKIIKPVKRLNFSMKPIIQMKF